MKRTDLKVGAVYASGYRSVVIPLLTDGLYMMDPLQREVTPAETSRAKHNVGIVALISPYSRHEAMTHPRLNEVLAACAHDIPERLVTDGVPATDRYVGEALGESTALNVGIINPSAMQSHSLIPHGHSDLQKQWCELYAEIRNRDALVSLDLRRDDEGGGILRFSATDLDQARRFADAVTKEDSR